MYYQIHNKRRDINLIPLVAALGFLAALAAAPAIGAGTPIKFVEEDGIIGYRSKDGAEQKVFDALQWLAAMCSHVPDKGEQMVRYCGYYSNVSRGKRNKQNQDGPIPCILEAYVSKTRCQKNWARLIQKMYKVDRLACPMYDGQIRITGLPRAKVLLHHRLV